MARVANEVDGVRGGGLEGGWGEGVGDLVGRLVPHAGAVAAAPSGRRALLRAMNGVRTLGPGTFTAAGPSVSSARRPSSTSRGARSSARGGSANARCR